MKYDYDTLIIGGGITGACVLWDATLRGMKSLLVEKNDFASGTSQATSKLIHGGLRYLKNFEIGLVRESLRERKNLAKITPHSVYTLGFSIPLYSQKEKYMLRAGMELYNLLSWDRNKTIGEDNTIPRYSYWDRKRAIHEIPGIPRNGLLGAYLYYDYANLNPERHTTEFIFSAIERGGHVKNYTEAKNIELLPGNEGYKISLFDKIHNKSETIYAKTIVNAGGPWADIVESKLGIPTEKHIVRSKGIHIVTRKICNDHCIVLKKRDGSHLFVIPWRGKTIIGTTDTVYEGDPDKFHISRMDIEELLSEVNNSYGETNLTLQDVDFYYGGMRPLVEDPGDSSSSYNASRKAEVMDYKEFGYPGFFSALGGKYTTSRAVAEAVVDHLADFLPGSHSPCITENTPLMGGYFRDFKSLAKDIQKRHPHISGEKIETLIHRYGSITDIILSISDSKYPTTSFSLSGGELLYPEEIIYIARNESIHYATDFFFRRSGVGVPGCPSKENLEGIMKILGKELKWNPQRIRNETELVLSRYKIPE